MKQPTLTAANDSVPSFDFSSDASSTTDQHQAWLELHRLNERWYATVDDSHCEQFAERDHQLINLIWRTPAKTIDGLRAQIELLADQKITDYLGEPELAAYSNMLATLDSLRG